MSNIFGIKIVAMDPADARLADAATMILSEQLAGDPQAHTTVVNHLTSAILGAIKAVGCLCPDCSVNAKSGEADPARREQPTSILKYLRMQPEEARPAPEPQAAVDALMQERDKWKKNAQQMDAERAHWKRWAEESEDRERSRYDALCHALYGKVDPTISWEQIIQEVETQRKTLHSILPIPQGKRVARVMFE